jgi:hypothetical protein
MGPGYEAGDMASGVMGIGLRGNENNDFLNARKYDGYVSKPAPSSTLDLWVCVAMG